MGICILSRTTGSLQHKGAPGRPKECGTVENIETVRLSVIEDPKKSYRKRVQALNMKLTSLLTILRKDLEKIMYKCHIIQLLTNSDKAARLAMCLLFRQEIGNGNDWIEIVWFWFRDEAHFYLNGIVNSQSLRTAEYEQRWAKSSYVDDFKIKIKSPK